MPVMGLCKWESFLSSQSSQRKYNVYSCAMVCSPVCLRYIEPRHDKTNSVVVRLAKTQISLVIRPVWSESSLSGWRKPWSVATHWAHSEDSDQTGRMPRLIWVFAGRTLILLVLSCHCSYSTCLRYFTTYLRYLITSLDILLQTSDVDTAHISIFLRYPSTCLRYCVLHLHASDIVFSICYTSLRYFIPCLRYSNTTQIFYMFQILYMHYIFLLLHVSDTLIQLR